MSGSSFPIQIKGTHSPNASFFQWIKSNSALFIGQIAAVISLILYTATFFYYVAGYSPKSNSLGLEAFLKESQKLLFFLNIIFCVIFITVNLYVLNKNDNNSEHVKKFYKLVFGNSLREELLFNAKKQLNEFKFFFLLYWAYVLFYYLLNLLFEHQFSNKTLKVSFANGQYLTFLLGNLMAVILYIIFSKMILSNQVKYYFKDIQGKKKQVVTSFLLKPVAPLMFYLAASIFPFIYNNSLIKSQVKIDDWFRLVNLFSGVIKMIILSILISRFDSKLIGLPSWLVSILYIYAAIQPLEVTITGEDIISRSLNTTQYAIAFIIKIYFFLIIIYALQTGRMLNFFCCNGEMNKRLQESRNPEK